MAKKTSKKSTNKKNKKQEEKETKMAKKKKNPLAKKLDSVKKMKKLNFDLKKQLMSTKTLIIVGVLALITILILSKDLFIAAMVNGQPISRLKILKQAEQAQGSQILDSLITDQLILQKAREEGVKVTEQAIDEQLDEIKQTVSEQGQDFESLLTMQGMTEAELRYRIKIQKVVENLLGSQVEVAEEEVAQYVEDNKEFFPEDASEEEMQEQARQQLEQQKLSEKYQTWLKDLRGQAKVRYFVNYGQEE